MACAIVGEADHLVARRKLGDAGTDLFDNPGQVAALARRECRGEHVVQEAFTDLRLAWVDPGGPDGHQQFAVAWCRPWDLDDVQDLDPAVLVEPDCAWHFTLPKFETLPITAGP